MDETTAAEMVMEVACEDEFDRWGFGLDSTDDWGDGRVSVFLSDRYDNEVEVVVTEGMDADACRDEIWSEIEGGAAAAASLEMEKNAERTQMGVTW